MCSRPYSLFRNQIGDAGAKKLAESMKGSGCVNLQDIKYGCPHRDRMVFVPLPLKRAACTVVRELWTGPHPTGSLKNNGIGDDGVIALADSVKHCPRLQTISYARAATRIKGGSSQSRHRFTACQATRGDPGPSGTLSLGGNVFGVVGVRALCQAFSSWRQLSTIEYAMRSPRPRVNEYQASDVR